ncbi:hypothetical protein AHiyo8_00220 [Arthrobacter sp. Hiyo8]|uniref:hypothetical protein n=1 Tax=Arthrobacter sp. Hiyo1 TaxID=1588020 RepID=UPI0006839D18|nr:hypothetical protein [Arthrobacter sp. Hiyo1]BAS11719.1 hypothetical protein AHiyo8_00220 [Arthrobacter sp. Hiyo8]GAP61236.1 hypothetical protein AHiyo1_49160 [Arthrobacter sp. Hiyo1]
MNNDPDYEYMTVLVDRRPRKQSRELKKLAKNGWEVVSVRPRSGFSWSSNTDDATLRRVRNSRR